MDPITGIIAGIGLATSLYGAQQAQKQGKKQLRAQQAVVKVQNASYAAQAETTKQLSGISAQQEALRKQALILENATQARNIARATQLARATALTKASNSGAQFSTGLQGVQASITNQGAEQATTLNQNFQAGLKGFDLNQKALQIQTQNAVAQSGFNQRIASLGGQASTAAAKADFGKTLFSTGIGLIQNSTQTSGVFKSLFTGTS